jgi:nucleoside-diphosphate-sugar epimerase
MIMAHRDNFIIGKDDFILVTGAGGFIGSRVVETLLRGGFRKVRCLVRSEQRALQLEKNLEIYRQGAQIEVLCGNLLSKTDCTSAVEDVSVVYHLAAGAGEKSVPDAFLNSVVTTRNLLDALTQQNRLKRFVNISSIAVYDVASNKGKLLNESSRTEPEPHICCDAYEFAKIKQDELVFEYTRKFAIPVVTIRPGYVYGPGRPAISGRVGIRTFGPFIHLGGPNLIPLSYVDNCADAIVLAGLTAGIDGEVINIIDDDIPSSRQFLRLYKKRVKRFKSLYLPHLMSYLLSWLWESYSTWSEGQLPPTFNRKRWYRYWKETRYSNLKAKELLGWAPAVSMTQGLERYFDSCRAGGQDA